MTNPRALRKKKTRLRIYNYLIKNYINKKGIRVNPEVYGVINELIYLLIDAAIEEVKKTNRKTMLPKHFGEKAMLIQFLNNL